MARLGQVLRRVGAALQILKSGSVTVSDWFGEGFDAPSRLGGRRANVTNPYRQSPWVYAGVRGKAINLVGLPFVIKIGNRSAKEGRRLEATDPLWGDLVRLFANPSRIMHASRFWEALSVFLDLRGEWFVVKLSRLGQFARRGEVPSELLPINPRNVLLSDADIDRTTRLVRYWTMRIDDRQTIKVPAESVIQHALLNPEAQGADAYRGLAPVDAAAQGISVEYKADSHAANMLDNDCTPGGILSVDYDPRKEQVDQLKKSWKDQHQGAKKSGEIAVLGKGASYQQLSFSPREMLMPERHKLSREQIQAVLAVTPFEMGYVSDFNDASAKSALKWLWRNSLIPRLHEFEEVLWSQLFRPLSTSIAEEVWGEFDLSSVDGLLEDITEKTTQAEALLRMGYTLNQTNDRLRLGMPNVEWGDTPGSGGMVGLGMPPLGAIQIVGGGPGGAIQITAAPSGNSTTAGEGAVVIGGEGGGVQVRNVRGDGHGWLSPPARAFRPGTAGPSHRRPTTAPHPSSSSLDRAARVKAALPKKQSGEAMRDFDEAAGDMLGVHLSRFYVRMMKHAVEHTPREKALDPLTEAQIDTLLGAPQVWRDLAEEFLKAPMEKVARGSVRNAGRVLGGFDVVEIDDPQWLVEAGRRTAQMVRIATRWRSILRDRIFEAIRDDASVTSIAQVIEREFGDVIASNGMTIARTEAGMLSSQIRKQVFKAEGVEQKEWSSADDDHVRESHREVDGEVVGIDEKFSNGLSEPLEPGGPPEEVINCRCVALPIA